MAHTTGEPKHEAQGYPPTPGVLQKESASCRKQTTGVAKRAQRELKSPQISETKGLRAGVSGVYARFVRDNTRKGTTGLDVCQ